MEKCVDHYLSHYHNELINDEPVKLFLMEYVVIIQKWQNLIKKRMYNFVDCIVTAFHEQVGSVMDNCCIELDWNDVKLYKNKKDKTRMSKNDFVMLALLVVLTGTRNPYIIKNFTHVLRMII